MLTSPPLFTGEVAAHGATRAADGGGMRHWVNSLGTSAKTALGFCIVITLFALLYVGGRALPGTGSLDIRSKSDCILMSKTYEKKFLREKNFKHLCSHYAGKNSYISNSIPYMNKDIIEDYYGGPLLMRSVETPHYSLLRFRANVYYSDTGYDRESGSRGVCRYINLGFKWQILGCQKLMIS